MRDSGQIADFKEMKFMQFFHLYEIEIEAIKNRAKNG